MMRNRVFLSAALALCIACGLSAAPISVTTLTGPTFYFSGSAAIPIEVLAPATVQIEMDYELGCTPEIPYCPAFKIEVDFTDAVLGLSSLSSGGDVLPYTVCGGVANSLYSCVENVQPGVYELSALLYVQSTSFTSVASASFVTGTLSVISGGPVVAAPEPRSAILLGPGCCMFFLFWIQRRKSISGGASGCFSRHSA